MSNYNQILNEFKLLNYNDSSLLTQLQLKKALDTICRKNTKVPSFNTEVAQQLFQQTQKTQNGRVSLKNFINVVVRGQAILKQHINKCQSELAAGAMDKTRRIQLEQSLDQYRQDLNILSVPFQIQPAIQSRVSGGPMINSRMSQSGIEDNSGFFSGRNSGIFSDIPSQREESTSLKLTFLLTIILFGLQIIITFHKHHFYNTLIYIAIFSIVFLGYFDKYYMRFVLFNIGLSVLFDFIWLLSQASPYWNPNPPTHHSTIQTPFLRFLFFFVIVLMLAKVFLFILFFRYRNNQQSVRKSISFFGNVFQINGRVKENNPVSRLLSGKGLFASSLQ